MTTGQITDKTNKTNGEDPVTEKLDLILEMLQDQGDKLDDIEEKLQNLSVPYDEDFRES